MRSPIKSARRYIREALKGANPFTPEVLETGWIAPHIAYELSEGASPFSPSGNICAVTILDIVAMPKSAEAIQRDNEMSRCFNGGETRADNLASARDYIASLRERFAGEGV